MASTQKGVAGCTESVGAITSGVGAGGGGSDSGVKATVLEAVSQCIEATEEAFAACTESVIDAKQALHEKFAGEPTGGNAGAIAAGLAMPRGRRTVVMAPSITIPTGWKPPVYKKSAMAEGFLMQALATNKLFKTLAPSDCEMLMKAFQEVRFKQGQQIIREGEPGDKFYLLDSGTCDIAVQGKGTVMKAKRGVAFGELALLHNAPRAATVTAESDVGAWQVDATTFKSILMSKSKTDAQDYASFIKEVPLLRSLSKEAVRSLLDALEEQAFGAEQQIVKEGDTGDAFYIVREGEVKCTAKKSKVEVSRRLKRSDFFGELSLLSSAKRAATVSAVVPTKVLRLERVAFERILGPLVLSKEMKEAIDAQGRAN
jgi:cAMP-dependent protein kinase regulator